MKRDGTHKSSCVEHPKFRPGCEPCQRIKSAYNQRLILARINGRRQSAPADLTRQRLRELRALGYGINELAERTGINRSSIQRLCLDGVTGRVQLGTFHSVERVWSELRCFPKMGDRRAADWAERNGWTPPPPLPAPEAVDENDIDEIAVEKAVRGERVPLTRAETLVAWERMEALGLLPWQIADRLHTTPRTIARWRSRQHRPSTTVARKPRQRTA